MQTDTIWKRATRRLATRLNAQGRKVQRRNLAVEGRGTKSSWDKLNKSRLEPLAQVNIDSGQIYWHASILAELRELNILDEEEAEQEDETTLDDPDGMEEDNQEHENERDHSDEDNDEPGHRRDENDEY